MRDKLTKKYSNGEITVVWKPKLCIHSGNCWRGLNAVFNPQVHPWVNTEGASSEEIVAQVGKCPSGALSIFRNDFSEPISETGSGPVIEVTPDGPLELSGEFILKHRDGAIEKISGNIALCRCGRSGNKPFCDGSHTSTGFKG